MKCKLLRLKFIIFIVKISKLVISRKRSFTTLCMKLFPSRQQFCLFWISFFSRLLLVCACCFFYYIAVPILYVSTFFLFYPIFRWFVTNLQRMLPSSSSSVIGCVFIFNRCFVLTLSSRIFNSVALLVFHVKLI